MPGGAVVDPRWVGSGWTIFNNKGKPVRQYEPFFSPTHAFEFARTVGVSPMLFYDPLRARGRDAASQPHLGEGRLRPLAAGDAGTSTTLRRSTTPPRTCTRATSSHASPRRTTLPTWTQLRINGALGTAEQDAARKTALHADTPTVAHLDSLERVFLTIAHNRSAQDDAPPVDTLLESRVVRDIEDNLLDVIDARQRVAMHYDVDMLGSRSHTASMDAGERWVLLGVLGKPVRMWDGRGHAFRTEYDRLHRIVGQFVRGIDATESDPRVLDREVMFQKIEYGEGQPDDLAMNLRTRACRSYDGAGMLASTQYDYKGNVLRAHRQLAYDYKGVADWAGSVDLEPDLLPSSMRYDAMNRVVSSVRPDDSETQFTFNDAGLLQQVSVRLRGATAPTSFVAGIDYNAKGQRERIAYGNGVVTKYEYDPLTFRLIRLSTSRDRDGDLQDLHYTFDPAGNISFIRDDAQQTVYFANTAVTADGDYRYDALYQLIGATGREHVGLGAQPDAGDPLLQPLPHPNDGEALRRYVESYQYDPAGNLMQMAHRAAGGNWTRSYRCAENGNRLLSSSLPGDDPVGPFSARYAYDALGSMTRMPHLSAVAWNFAQQIQATSTQVVNDGTPETTYYVYDAAGQRVRKVTERQSTSGAIPVRMKERLYVTGFEIYREYDGSGENVRLQRDTLHVSDDKQRFALVETRTVDTGAIVPMQVPVTRFQLGNHLGSATLELDDAARLVSYEEFHPYGTTSYRASSNTLEVNAKRFRYSGKERDEETGLYYYGARYYAAWLGRWCSADPSGIRDGSNLYCFVHNNPMIAVDQSGNSSLVFMGLLQSDNGKVDLNDLNSEPLLTPENVTAFWNGGGNNLVMGVIIFTGGAIVIVGTGGAATPFVLVTSGMAVGGGAFGMGAGSFELSGRAYGAFGEGGTVLNEEQTVMFNRLANIGMSVGSSPGGLIGGTAGLAYGGDLDTVEKGAAVGGLVEFGVVGVQSLRGLLAETSDAPGKIWQTSVDKRIAVDNPVAVPTMDVLSTHGSRSGRVEVLGAMVPVGATAPLVMATSSERFLVASCSVACDPAAMQSLANRTNTIIGGFLDPVSFDHGADFLVARKWAWQVVETPADEWGVISEVLKLQPAPGGAMSVPVWFLPDEEAVKFFQMLRVGGYGAQQAEYAKDVVTP